MRAVVLGERSASYGAHGANLAHEVKSALKDDPDNRTLCLSRIYGLGGRDFYAEDAEAFFRLALEAAETRPAACRSTTTVSSRAIRRSRGRAAARRR